MPNVEYSQSLNLKYFDIIIAPTEELGFSVLKDHAMRLLHFHEGMAKSRYALAFPDAKGSFVGRVIRVFATKVDYLKEMVAYLKGQFFFRDYSDLGPVKEVPTDFKGKWRSYSRYRIPSSKSDRNGTNLRERRLVEAQGLPCFCLKSESTKQSFTLRIKIGEESGPSKYFNLNGYGLSSAKAPVALPDLPRI